MKFFLTSRTSSSLSLCRFFWIKGPPFCLKGFKVSRTLFFSKRRFPLNEVWPYSPTPLAPGCCCFRIPMSGLTFGGLFFFYFPPTPYFAGLCSPPILFPPRFPLRRDSLTLHWRIHLWKFTGPRGCVSLPVTSTSRTDLLFTTFVAEKLCTSISHTSVVTYGVYTSQCNQVLVFSLLRLLLLWAELLVFFFLHLRVIFLSTVACSPSSSPRRAPALGVVYFSRDSVCASQLLLFCACFLSRFKYVFSLSRPGTSFGVPSP